MSKSIKLFKASYRLQSGRLNVLKERLDKLRERFKSCDDVAIKNSIELEGKQLRKECDKVEDYVKACHALATNFAGASEIDITGLSNFKYWSVR